MSPTPVHPPDDGIISPTLITGHCRISVGRSVSPTTFCRLQSKKVAVDSCISGSRLITPARLSESVLYPVKLFPRDSGCSVPFPRPTDDRNCINLEPPGIIGCLPHAVSQSMILSTSPTSSLASKKNSKKKRLEESLTPYFRSHYFP